MDHKIFEQMLIMLKPGGHIIFTARFSYMGEFWYQGAIDDLIKLGRISFISSEIFSKYDKLEESVGRFQK